ncbi:3-oxoacyl-ACP reductase FabG [Methylophilaceae bacterium]|jgi:3-oxoacyl-[acyl-carrier protein] reductase|nr:3-oxoacyl-ACP reductase FabG [Nitrosomonadales bacterium]MCH9781622.1 3-oxoacyl-ACP reductase FabG [Betaproteobacteria bacterium]MDA7751505.1 3-oxoacyl-ACP reductase FabG [Methylophilaceae bacterium]MDA9085430.1 3-oxoacyl-ACP reductase FabG [Methylophilaceae bacterium]MDC1281685.1 3-oxoacyl-ACP reductase FabG [Methylophilaceae bacterium]
MTQLLTNKIALVTGASRGIGAAIAEELGNQGARIYGTATSEQGALSITKMFEEHKIDGQGLVLNVNDNASIQATIAKINQDSGAINILINNAGITKDTLLMRMKDEDWDTVISTNLTSVYKLSQHVIKSMMKERYGRIINITSVVGHMGNAGQTNYAATKAGIDGFTKSLAQEIGSRGITVNSVAPGFIDTDMTKALSEEQRSALLTHIPLSRLGQASDIAHAVTFLASDHASYITGETLHVNGGMLMV